MKVSVVLPAYNKAIYLGATLDSWFQWENLPDEIIIAEDYTTKVKPEDRLLSIIDAYRWPQGVAVRYFQRNKTLRELYPKLIEATKKSLNKYGELLTPAEIADAWYNGGSLINNGASCKNFIARVATGDIIISTDVENIETVDVVELARSRLKPQTALYQSQVYQVEPITGERQKLAFVKKPYWYTVIMWRQEFLALGGIPEIFDREWGWEDEAFALSLKRRGIAVGYPPRLVVHHQNHEGHGKVYVDHNKAAKEYYLRMTDGRGDAWVNNETRGHTEWGSADGWNEIKLNLKRSS